MLQYHNIFEDQAQALYLKLALYNTFIVKQTMKVLIGKGKKFLL